MLKLAKTLEHHHSMTTISLPADLPRSSYAKTSMLVVQRDQIEQIFREVFVCSEENLNFARGEMW